MYATRYFGRLISFATLVMWFGGMRAAMNADAALIAEYTFDNVGNSVFDSAPELPNYALGKQPNGADFASANLFGSSSIGTLLGQAGLMQEPVEPTSQVNNYGFWTSKELLRGRSEWTLLLWVNRREAVDEDFLFYVGTGDGHGGTGSETSLFLGPGGDVRAHNYSGSTRDMDLRGGTVEPGTWQQVGMTRSGSTVKMYLDGVELGSDNSVSMRSFDKTGNTVIVFGAAKWMRLAYMRARVFDGLLDQIEVYDQALDQNAIASRYNAFAVPEPSTLALGVLGLVGLLAFARQRHTNRGGR